MRTNYKHILFTFRSLLALFIFLNPVVTSQVWAATSWLFTSDHDLPNSLINDLVEDEAGNIWIATEDGLCRYDGSNFTTYRHVADEDHSLRHNLVRCLFVDKEGHLLVGTMDGLQLYRPETDDFSLPAKAADNSIWPGNISQIIQDSKGIIHVCGNVSCNVSILEDNSLDLYFSPLTYKVDMTQCMVEDNDGVFWICQSYKEVYQMAPDGTVKKLNQNGQGVVCSQLCLGADGAIYMAGELPGLYRFDEDSQRFVLISNADDHFVASTLKLLPDGRLMVGTDGNGLLLFDYKTQTLSPYSFESYQLIPSTQKVHAVLMDRDRSLWLGLYQKGVLATASQLLPFHYIGHKTELLNGIGDKCVSSITRTEDGMVWVSTDNGGIFCIDSVGNPVRQFPYSYSKDGIPQAVLSLYEDHQQRLWFGSFHRGFGILDRKTGRCTYYPIKGQQEASNVYAFAEDQKHRLWAAGMGCGPLLFDEQSLQMVQVSDESFAMWSTSVLFDTDNNHLFFGSYNGLLEIDPEDENRKIVRHLDNTVIHSVSKFGGSKLCVSTDTGLFIYDYLSREYIVYSTADGLSSNTIYAAAAVSSTEIWLSSNCGLSRLQLPQGEVSNYTVYDGLQSNEFYKNAYMMEADGTLWFGGMEGITYFNPKDIEEVNPIFDVRVIQRTPHTIQLGIVPLLYTHRARYSYSFDGGEWISLPHGTNTLTLPELSSGQHKLYYRASVDGVETQSKVEKLYVDYPWYLQWWFLLVCFLLVAATIIEGSIHLYHRRRDKLRLRRHEQAEAINDAKLSFFTNISHEIRTPMTLIVSPLERLIAEESDQHRLHTYQLMQRNANRILGLINQLLDLRKIDKNQMELLCAETELAPYLDELVQNFSDVAEMRQQTLSFTSTAKAGLKAWVDVSNFDKIVVNLLSNALKYTPQKGNISVLLAQQDPSDRFSEGSFSISVADSGIGIAPEDRTHIFERFYQVRNSKGKYGTGIGLHLTRTLVQLHHGQITVGDNPAGEGTLFTVTLPLGNSHLTPEQCTVVAPKSKEEPKKATDTSSIAAASLTNEEDTNRGAKHLTRRRVLVVDDDDEIRTYLSQQLSEFYYVCQCSNGREALDQILRQTPDIVISDVMMPEMDGNELCSRIRNNVLISHVPVILLTARSRQEDQILGLEVGADAFLPKPFNIDVLLKLVQNVIRNHDRLKNTFSGQQIQTANVEVVIEKTPDERLMERINRVLNENISKPSLSAEMLADQVGLSRVHLYRKLKELTNQSARDYIRNMRIIKAAELLSNRKMAIGEVAAKVGYTDQRNFSTAFKSIYGMTPSEYMESHINSKPSAEEEMSKE